MDEIQVEQDQVRARLRALRQKLDQAARLAHPGYFWDAV